MGIKTFTKLYQSVKLGKTMLKKRIIVCLDVKDGRTTKGVKFLNNVDIGDPVEMAKEYYPRLWSADRIEALYKKGLLTKEEAILRVGAEQLDHLLHPMLDPKAEKKIIATEYTADSLTFIEKKNVSTATLIGPPPIPRKEAKNPRIKPTARTAILFLI